MFQSLEFFTLVFLSVSAESLTGNVLAPQNVSIQWINDFETKLSWDPPRDLVANCTPKYKVISMTRERYSGETRDVDTHEYCFYTVMKGGFLSLSVKTICGDKSGVVVHNFTYPDLVWNVMCYIRSSRNYECLWLTATDVPDLRFFFRFPSQSSNADCTAPLPLQECSSYLITNGKRTGCNLQDPIAYDIHMVFNGTLNNTLVRNTFRQTNPLVRPPALEWTITEAGDKFNISVIPPDYRPSRWTLLINYTECGKEKHQLQELKTAFQMPRLLHCPYYIQIKAEIDDGKGGWTPWSEKLSFGAITDPNPMVYAIIPIPIVFAALAVLTFICYKKNKETIFPKVPEPRDLVSDISDNNNKSNVRNLYIPAAEEEDCKITLVLDPQFTQLDS
ncbi:uncharacterized protein LOC134005829 [Scomber scombrus]|uniref:uncharacterized protein LOC134005829 n=1 Tax=Scomber scombrus TaxID=13677 RepID=UPI002DDACE21|nr:uncharacterized protein LOC134005829 [Scomber scombrus]